MRPNSAWLRKLPKRQPLMLSMMLVSHHPVHQPDLTPEPALLARKSGKLQWQDYRSSIQLTKVGKEYQLTLYTYKALQRLLPTMRHTLCRASPCATVHCAYSVAFRRSGICPSCLGMSPTQDKDSVWRTKQACTDSALPHTSRYALTCKHKQAANLRACHAFNDTALKSTLHLV